MVGPSKILTVSYGAFSCTLEGFDEPFEMMKAVAEYFRGLAAEDRYFGAEPPKPDEAMLQQMAEREIHRRVEAKMGEHGVTLRQVPDHAETPELTEMPAPVPPDMAQAPSDQPASVAAEAEQVIEAAAPAAEPVVMSDEAPPADLVPGGELLPEAAAPVAEAPVEVIPVSEAAPVQAPAPRSADLPVLPTMAAPRQPTAAEPAPPADSDSIAAKLMRIRAVVDSVRVSQRPTALEEEPDVLPTIGDAQPDAAAFAEKQTGAASDRMIVEPAPQPEEAGASAYPDDDEDLTGPQDDIRLRMALPEDEDETDVLSEEDAELRLRIAEMRKGFESKSPAIEAIAAPPAPAAEPQTARRTPAAWDDESADEADETSGLAAARPDEVAPGFFQRARARVLRIGKSALGQQPDEAEGPVIADAEADEVHVEASADITPPEADDEFGRLMEEARVKLEGVENRRRFNAISHLKAAVAATLADRQMQTAETEGDQAPESESEMDLYREDLSKAVRPRRASSERPATVRPHLVVPPLVLVSEQRVDAGGDAASALPRRVAAGAEEDDDWAEVPELTPDEVGSFAEFAERLGAHSLTELLEAAAVYTASVEGQTYFTRPHLLRKVEFVSSRGGFDREEGLRSFGTLLREGKILKISRGQFAVAEASKYMIETRRAAN